MLTWLNNFRLKCLIIGKELFSIKHAHKNMVYKKVAEIQCILAVAIVSMDI